MNTLNKILLPVLIVLLITLCITISSKNKRIRSLSYSVDDLEDRVQYLEDKLDYIRVLAAEGEGYSEDWYLHCWGYYQTNIPSVMDDCESKFYEIEEEAQY